MLTEVMVADMVGLEDIAQMFERAKGGHVSASTVERWAREGLLGDGELTEDGFRYDRQAAVALRESSWSPRRGRLIDAHPTPQGERRRRRRERMVELMREDDRISRQALAEALDTNYNTLMRDVRWLQRQGRLTIGELGRWQLRG